MCNVLKLLLRIISLGPSLAICSDSQTPLISQIKYISLDIDSSLEEASSQLASGNFIDHKRTPYTPKHSEDKLWVYLSLSSRSAEDYFVSSYSCCYEELRIFKQASSGTFEEISQDIHRQGTFKLEGSADYLISLTSYNTMIVGFLFETTGEFNTIMLSAAIGIFGILIIYSLILFLTLREKSYLYFLFFVLAYLLFISTIT